MITRILCIIDTLGRGGGAEHLVANLAAPLKLLNVEVVFVDLFSWPNDLGVDLEKGGFTVIRLNLKKDYSLAWALPRLLKLVGKISPDVVWGHLRYGTFYTCLLGFLLNLPTVVTFHSNGSPAIARRSLKGQILERIELFLANSATHKVAVSGAVKNTLIAQRGLHDARVIHNGVDMRLIKASISRSKSYSSRSLYSQNQDDFFIVVPARLVPEKGHAILIEALSILSEAYGLHPKVLAVGEQTELLETLVGYCHYYGIDSSQLRFIPSMQQDDLYTLIASADAVVVPSVREAFGLVAVEAMALGTPAILSKTGGLAELDPRGEIAHYFQSGAADSLAQAIMSVMMSKDDSRERAQLGMSRIRECFSIERCAENWSTFFAEILTSHTNSK